MIMLDPMVSMSMLDPMVAHKVFARKQRGRGRLAAPSDGARRIIGASCVRSSEPTAMVRKLYPQSCTRYSSYARDDDDHCAARIWRADKGSYKELDELLPGCLVAHLDYCNEKGGEISVAEMLQGAARRPHVQGAGATRHSSEMPLQGFQQYGEIVEGTYGREVEGDVEQVIGSPIAARP